jgi:hypothetical protein
MSLSDEQIERYSRLILVAGRIAEERPTGTGEFFAAPADLALGFEGRIKKQHHFLAYIAA